MRDVVEEWARANMWRYVVTGIAVGISAGGMVLGR
jgi:hypothetical protein